LGFFVGNFRDNLLDAIDVKLAEFNARYCAAFLLLLIILWNNILIPEL